MTVPRKGGRPKLASPRTSRHVYIDEALNAEVDLLLFSPGKGKIAYGSWSNLVEALLRQWVEEQRLQAKEQEDERT